MREFIRRMRQVEVDSTKIFLDLIAFATYLIVAVYAGGSTYIKIYFGEFGTVDFIMDTPADVISYFGSKVIIDYWPFVLFLLIVFAVAFFLCRYVFATWFGYIMLCSLFSATVVSSILVGSACAVSKAKYDKLDNSQLPIVNTIKFTKNAEKVEKQLKTDCGNRRLLYQDGNYIYVFCPGEGEILVDIINRENIQHLQVKTMLAPLETSKEGNE